MNRLVCCAAILLGWASFSYAQDTVPVGAYASWERVVSNARHMRQETWEYFDSLLSVLAGNGLHWIWVTNFPISELQNLQAAAEKNSQEVLVNASEIEIRVRGRDIRYYSEIMPPALESLHELSPLYAWVLSDEPTPGDAHRTEQIAEFFRSIDPVRKTAVVATHGEYAAFQAIRGLEIECVDIYPFFGPGDPNGPNTAIDGQRFFRRVLSGMRGIESHGKAFWVMMQSFSEIWGPRRFTDDYHLVGLPGSYLHWRQPSPAEIRWQFWEALRNGGTGFFFFTATSEAPDLAAAAASSPDVCWKWALAKVETDLGPNALLNPDLSSTPQLDAVSDIARRLIFVPDLTSWTRSRRAVTAKGRGDAQAFSASDGRELVVVVNDLLTSPTTLEVSIDYEVHGARELTQTYAVELLQKKVGVRGSTFSVRLGPGDGAIIELVP
jgi:hypothetical protein